MQPLPVELRYLISSFLGIKDLLCLSETCREERNYFAGPELWKFLITNNYPGRDDPEQDVGPRLYAALEKFSSLQIFLLVRCKSSLVHLDKEFMSRLYRAQANIELY